MEYLNRIGIKEATPSLIAPSKLYFTTKEKSRVEQSLSKLDSTISSPDTSAEDKQKALTIKTQLLGELERKQNYFEQDVFRKRK